MHLLRSHKSGQVFSEVDIHFPGLRNAGKKPVLVFPEILVCLNCGKAEFTVPEDEIKPTF